MLIYAKIVIQLELLLEHIVELTHGKFKNFNISLPELVKTQSNMTFYYLKRAYFEL